MSQAEPKQRHIAHRYCVSSSAAPESGAQPGHDHLMPESVPELSIVIPVYNEADNIAGLLSELRTAVEALSCQYEVLVIDDHSGDQTLAKLCETAEHWKALRILHHAQRRGQSAAIHNGVSASRASWIITLDGDGQNDPADMLGLLNARDNYPYPSQLGMICGNRSYARKDPWLKRLASLIANHVRGSLLNDGTPDTGCGLKLMRRETFMRLPFFDHMHRFLPALVLMSGMQVQSIPVNHRPRRHGQSKYGILDRLIAGVVDLCGVIWLKHRTRRAVFEEVDHNEYK